MPTADQEINNIKIRVAAMCELVTGMCRDGIQALTANDQKLADEVVSRDAQVDALEVELEEKCLRFLALHAPKAFELRYAVAVSRMISDLERIADHSKSIGRQVHEHYCASILARLPDFAALTDLVSGMLAEAAQAFFKSDALKYLDLVEKDRAVGEYQRGLNQKLVDIIAREANSIGAAVALINVVRRLERIADHAKSITLLIPYLTDGTVMRHKDKSSHADNDH
jgi:phosphate transport system protein